MTFEYIVEKDKKKTLSESEELEVVKEVVKNFDDWDNIRQNQLDIYDKLKKEIYLEDRKDSKKEEWESQKNSNKIYSLFQTSQAFLWENLYSNINKMFDVSGKDKESDETAKYQKANLVNSFNKMKVNQQLDKAIEYKDVIGELCLFTFWKKKYKQIRRSLTFKENLVENGLLSIFKKETATAIFNQEIYNGAYIKAINPINIVFDPIANPEDKDEWDKCGKIIKSWQTYDNIANNEIYKINAKDLKEIKDLISKNKTESDSKGEEEKIDDIIDNDKIEVLEYWGDFVFNGDTLNNYVIVVIGRKYLARFMENPFIINPIINVATMRDPDSKRGIPNLYSIYDLAKSQEEDINEVKDTQQLNKNPPRYAPKGFFKENIKLSPGKTIEYDAEFEDPKSIIPIQVSLPNAERMVQYYDRTVAEVSGIYPNMLGQDETGNATATEIRTKVAGQTTRLSKDLDTLKQNGIIKMVENIAELLANEKNGKVEEIFMDDKGEKTAHKIDDLIRQGEYEYTYSDSSALADKRARFQEALELFKMAGQSPQLASQLNWKEILIKALDIVGIENSEKFFIEDNKAKIIQFINSIPPQIMPMVEQGIQNLMPQISEAMKMAQPQQGGVA